MKWFKHDSNANTDSKLQNVLLDYGLEGYGLYWYCIELIAGNVDADNITFSLEHDARIIARNTGSTAQKVEEMMRYFVNVGLFECSDGVITCMKMAKRLDQSMTSNKVMRAIIDKLKSENAQLVESDKSSSSQQVMTESCRSHDGVMQEEIRLEENKISLSAEADDCNEPGKGEESAPLIHKPENCPHQEIINLWHELMPELTAVKAWNEKRAKMLKARWNGKDMQGNKFNNLKFWRKYFEYIRESDWLMGKTGSGWSATLEWVITESNFNKIIEGTYHNAN